MNTKFTLYTYITIVLHMIQYLFTIVLYTVHNNAIVFIRRIVVVPGYYNMNNTTKNEGKEVREGKTFSFI